MKVKVPNGTPKIPIPLGGVLKFGGKPKGDHATHFLSWIEKPKTHNLVWNVHKQMIQLKGDL